MKKMISLFKILFNSWYGISVFKNKVSKNKAELLKLVGLLIIIAISFAPLLVGYIVFMTTYYDTFVMMGQPGVIITMGVVSASIIVLIFAAFFIMYMHHKSSLTICIICYIICITII